MAQDQSLLDIAILAAPSASAFRVGGRTVDVVHALKAALGSHRVPSGRRTRRVSAQHLAAAELTADAAKTILIVCSRDLPDESLTIPLLSIRQAGTKLRAPPIMPGWPRMLASGPTP